MLKFPSKKFRRKVGLKFYPRLALRQFYKRVLKQDITIKLPTGLRYICASWDKSASEVYYTNSDVDHGSEALLYALMEHGTTFVDVGAHTGYYSLYMLPKAGTVYAFEPDSKSVEYLHKNLDSHPKAQVIAKAVHHSSGTFELVERGYGFSYLSEVAEEKYKGNDAGIIEAVSLDDFFMGKQEAVGAIKIDIDGSDLEVIKGTTALIGRDQPYLLTELKSQQFAELQELLDGLGYYAFAFLIDSHPAKFERLDLERDYIGRVKMIFLAPASKTENVLAAAQAAR